MSVFLFFFPDTVNGVSELSVTLQLRYSEAPPPFWGDKISFAADYVSLLDILGLVAPT